MPIRGTKVNAFLSSPGNRPTISFDHSNGGDTRYYLNPTPSSFKRLHDFICKHQQPFMWPWAYSVGWTFVHTRPHAR